MSLTLQSLTGDSLAAVATYLSQNANSIALAGDQFIQGLADAKNTNFQIGDVPALGFTFLNFDAEINTAKNSRVAGPFLDLTSIDSKITELGLLAVPAAPTLTVPTVNIPSLDATAPVLDMPVRPVSNLPPAPTDAPSLQDIQPPDAPLVVLPNTPTFEELQLPVAPSFSLPSFVASAPQNQLVPPTNTFAYVDPGYTSSLKDPLVAKLLDGLTNGGYGIEPNDEQALWARARDRAEQQARIEYAEVDRQSVSTSFPMPQGAYFGRLDKARQKLQEALSEINREIALKRADLYVENRKFTIQEVQKYEQIAISLYNAVQERALNFAKESVQIGILIYDASVKNFNAAMDAYKTEAAVFETKIRAELVKAELFKAQIEAEKLRGDFNQTKVNLYTAQLQGVQQVVNLYKSRVEAANLLSQLQQQKLDAFKSRVMIFSETVRAKQAEYDMYRAGITGELAKLDVYKSQIESYTSRVQAEEVKARITLQGNEALLQQFKASVQRYEAQMQGFMKTVDAKLEKAKTQTSVYNVDVTAYKAYVDALMEGARVRVANQSVNNQWNIAALNSQVEQVKFRLEQLKLSVENMNSINRFGSEYFRTALGATLSGLNGLSVKAV